MRRGAHGCVKGLPESNPSQGELTSAPFPLPGLIMLGWIWELENVRHWGPGLCWLWKQRHHSACLRWRQNLGDGNLFSPLEVIWGGVYFFRLSLSSALNKDWWEFYFFCHWTIETHSENNGCSMMEILYSRRVDIWKQDGSIPAYECLLYHFILALLVILAFKMNCIEGKGYMLLDLEDKRWTILTVV